MRLDDKQKELLAHTLEKIEKKKRDASVSVGFLSRLWNIELNVWDAVEIFKRAGFDADWSGFDGSLIANVRIGDLEMIGKHASLSVSSRIFTPDKLTARFQPVIDHFDEWHAQFFLYSVTIDEGYLNVSPNGYRIDEYMNTNKASDRLIMNALDRMENE